MGPAHGSRRRHLARLARQYGLPLYGAGCVTGTGILEVATHAGEWRWQVAALRKTWDEAIPQRMGSGPLEPVGKES